MARSWLGAALPILAVLFVLGLAGIALRPEEHEVPRPAEPATRTEPAAAPAATVDETRPSAPATKRDRPRAAPVEETPPRQSLPPKSATLDLTLELPDARPIAGGSIRVTSGEVVRTATSDAAGRAMINAILPGPFELEVDKMDALLAQRFTGQAQEDQTIVAKLVLQPGTGVRGRTVDERGSPIGDVAITDAKRLPWGKGTELARSAGDGSFQLVLTPGDGLSINLWAMHGAALRDTLQNTPKSPWRLLLSRDDLANRALDVAVSPGNWVDVHDVQLERGCHIAVTVTDRGSTPVQGAKVSIARDPQTSAAQLPPGLLTAETGADGRAILSGLAPGLACAVIVSHAEFLPFRSEPTAPLERGREATLRVVLDRGASLAGKVQSEKALREGLHVRLFASGPRDAFSRALKVIECDASGGFAFSGLQAGTYDLEVRTNTQRIAMLNDVVLAEAEQKSGLVLSASEQLAIPIEVIGNETTRGGRLTLEVWDPASNADQPVSRRFLVLVGNGPRYGPYYLDTPHPGPFTVKLTMIATVGGPPAPVEVSGAYAGQKVEISLER